MRNMLLIARREYLEQVRGRAFRMTTFGLPAVFALVLGVGYLSSLGLGANRHMAIVAPDLALANQIRDQLVGDKEAKARVDVITQATPQERDILVRQVQAEQLDGLVWVEAAPGKIPSGSYISASSGDFITAARVKSALTHAVIDARLTSSGMKQDDADTLVDGIHVDTLQVKKDGSLVKTNAQAALWKGYVMAFLLSMTTMIYGMNVARSIIQEKTSRIFEVMLAIAKPGDLLAGKLIGVGAVGLTQIAIWLVAGAIILISPLAAVLMSGELAVHFTWTEAILFPVYFVLGLPALQLAVCRTGCHLRDRTRAADVYAVGSGAHVAELRVDHAHHQRLELDLVRPGVIFSAHCSRDHVPAHGIGDTASVATGRFDRSADAEHLGRALVLDAPLPRRHSHVRQARYIARTDALDSLQLARASIRVIRLRSRSIRAR